MTTLFMAPGARLREGTVTLQCDVCTPPVITSNTLEQLDAIGWLTTHRGEELDVCPVCRRRKPRSALEHRRAQPMPPEEPRAQMPSIFVIGAEKCATTSLHAYLDGHPDIGMSTAKELQFFSDPEADGWRDRYLRFFDPHTRLAGESSPFYTKHPLVPDVPERMSKYVSEPHLIYLVRDPVERTISAHTEQRKHDGDLRDVEVALSGLDDPYHPYLASSRYALQLKRYLAVFPQERILVLDMSELGDDPVGTMRRIFGFLGVDPDVALADEPGRLNTSAAAREYPPAVRWVRSTAATRVLHRLPDGARERLMRPVRRVLSRRLDRPEIPMTLRRDLEQVLAPDAEELRTLTGLSLGHWSV